MKLTLLLHNYKEKKAMDTLNNYLQKNEFKVLGLAAFQRYLENKKVSASFGNPYKQVPLLRKPMGYITTQSLFTKDTESNMYDSLPNEWVRNISKFKSTYGKWLVVDEQRDNTYNYDNYIDNAIDIIELTIQDPEGIQDDLVIALYRVCISLDVRGAYSPAVIGIYDYDGIDHFNTTGFLMNLYNTVNGSFKVNDKLCYFSIDEPVTGYDLQIEVDSGQGLLDPEETSEIDPSEKSSIQDYLENYTGEKINDLKVEYTSELFL